MEKTVLRQIIVSHFPVTFAMGKSSDRLEIVADRSQVVPDLLQFMSGKLDVQEWRSLVSHPNLSKSVQNERF